MLKTKMQRLTSVIMTSMAAASGSSTQPMPQRLFAESEPGEILTRRDSRAFAASGRKAASERMRAITCPAIASAAAPLRRAFDRLRINERCRQRHRRDQPEVSERS